MNYKNIIIVGELDYVLTANFAKPDKKAKCLEYTADVLPMSQGENGATNINSLYVLNEMLEKILEVKLQMNGHLPETSYIAIPKNLYTLIQKGSYKNLVKNDGVAKTGTVYDEREVSEWSRFMTLYGQLFSDVTLRDSSYYMMKNPKYDIVNMNKHKYLIKQMRHRIEEHKTELFESLI